MCSSRVSTRTSAIARAKSPDIGNRATRMAGEWVEAFLQPAGYEFTTKNKRKKVRISYFLRLALYVKCTSYCYTQNGRGE